MLKVGQTFGEIMEYFDTLENTHDFEYQRTRFSQYLKKKDKRRTVRWTYELKDEYSSQKLFLACIHKKDMPMNNFVIVPVIKVETSKDPVFITKIQLPGDDNRNGVAIISNHFLKRYAQRTNKPFILPSIIGDFIANEYTAAMIYMDKEEKRLVYGSESGLELCIKRGGILYYTTFVSLDLMGCSQREAYKEVFFNAKSKKINMKAIERSCEIYSEYFKD